MRRRPPPHPSFPPPRSSSSPVPVRCRRRLSCLRLLSPPLAAPPPSFLPWLRLLSQSLLPGGSASSSSSDHWGLPSMPTAPPCFSQIFTNPSTPGTRAVINPSCHPIFCSGGGVAFFSSLRLPSSQFEGRFELKNPLRPCQRGLNGALDDIGYGYVYYVSYDMLAS